MANVATMLVTPGGGKTTGELGDHLGDALQNRPSRFTSYHAFGDSITEATIYVNLIAAAFGLTAVNHGVGGSLMADQQPAIYQVTPNDTDRQLYTLMIGTNEGAFFGTASNRQDTFKALQQASLAWLAMPERSKVRGQRKAAAAVSISSLTSNSGTLTSTVATAVCAAPHGLTTGDPVTIAGAVQAAFNVTAPCTVVNSTTFTYPIYNLPSATATGTITVTGPGIVYSGTWTDDNTVLGGSVSRKTSVQNSKATFKAFGSTVYVAYGMQDADAGTFTIKIDGVLYGTYTTNGVGGGFAETGVLHQTHGSGLARLAGLSNAPHAIEVEMTSATGNVWLDWYGGTGSPLGTQYSGGPTVVCGGAPQQGNGVLTSQLYATLAQINCGLLASDGLNIFFADVAGAMNALTDISSDNTHPFAVPGHTHIFEAFYSAMSLERRWMQAVFAAKAMPFYGSILANLSYGNNITNSGPGGNTIVGGGYGTANFMVGSGNNNAVVAGANNGIGGGGTVNTNNNFLGAGTQNVVQFGGSNFLGAGTLNSVQGFYNALGAGRENKIWGSYSGAIAGWGFFDRSKFATTGQASGYFAVAGDAQTSKQVLRGGGASTSAFRLTADAAAAGAYNVANLPSGSISSYRVDIKLHVFDVTTPTKVYTYISTGILTKTTTANGSTVWTQDTPVTLAQGSFAPTVSVTADMTNGGLNISVTPPGGNTDTIRAVAVVDTVEIA